ncbi:MAG: tryptophan halogenase family protein [Paraglaciecola sp.]|uniref:tryptophan halogenase family protein n=1 Tax=Paraglaciecola sp. TaxID=1920173 RepID=UPI003298E084
MKKPQNAINKVVIVGGGTAGWMSASALASSFKNKQLDITLVESDQIGTIGVGEASIPHIKTFNRHIGVNEKDFMRRTQATFKLGIEFVDWKQKGERYFHPFGPYGIDMEGVSFHAFWQRLQASDHSDSLDQYNIMAMAAKQNRFRHPVQQKNTPLSEIGYAYHFDSTLYAGYLRELAEQKGVKRIEGRVVDTQLRNDNGFLQSISMENGQILEADLFIDCSGFYGLLIDKVFKVPFVDWSQYLPNNSAWAVGSEKIHSQPPYTRSTAVEAGWQWRIPLQERTGNGIVYSSAHTDDQTAQDTLLQNIEGKLLGEPRKISFTTGHREKLWVKNCVAIGLSSGFLEPLESTSIHLIQSGISRLIRLFPDLDFEQIDIDHFNQQSVTELEQIRDFLICHYKVTERTDSSYWQYCKNMEVPNSLSRKLSLFESRGRIFRENEELFNRYSWLAVMVGQGLTSRGYDANADVFSEQELQKRMADIKHVIGTSASSMPEHGAYVEKYCKS